MSRTVRILSSEGYRRLQVKSDAGPLIADLVADTVYKTGLGRIHPDCVSFVQVEQDGKLRRATFGEVLPVEDSVLNIVLDLSDYRQIFVFDQDGEFITSGFFKEVDNVGELIGTVAKQAGLNVERFLNCCMFKKGNMFSVNLEKPLHNENSSDVYATVFDLSNGRLCPLAPTQELPSELCGQKIDDILIGCPERVSLLKKFQQCEEMSPVEAKLVAKKCAAVLIDYFNRRLPTIEERLWFLDKVFSSYPNYDLSILTTCNDKIVRGGTLFSVAIYSAYRVAVERRFRQMLRYLQKRAIMTSDGLPNLSTAMKPSQHVGQARQSAGRARRAWIRFVNADTEPTAEVDVDLSSGTVKSVADLIAFAHADLKEPFRPDEVASVYAIDDFTINQVEMLEARVENGTVYEVRIAPSKVICYVLNQDCVERAQFEFFPSITVELLFKDVANRLGIPLKNVFTADTYHTTNFNYRKHHVLNGPSPVVVQIYDQSDEIVDEGDMTELPLRLTSLTIHQVLSNVPDMNKVLSKISGGRPLTEQELFDVADAIARPLQAAIVRRGACGSERQLFLKHLFKDYPKFDISVLMHPNADISPRFKMHGPLVQACLGIHEQMRFRFMKRVKQLVLGVINKQSRLAHNGLPLPLEDTILADMDATGEDLDMSCSFNQSAPVESVVTGNVCVVFDIYNIKVFDFPYELNTEVKELVKKACTQLSVPICNCTSVQKLRFSVIQSLGSEDVVTEEGPVFIQTIQHGKVMHNLPSHLKKLTLDSLTEIPPEIKKPLTDGQKLSNSQLRVVCKAVTRPLHEYIVRRTVRPEELQLFVKHIFRAYPETNLDQLIDETSEENVKVAASRLFNAMKQMRRRFIVRSIRGSRVNSKPPHNVSKNDAEPHPQISVADKSSNVQVPKMATRSVTELDMTQIDVTSAVAEPAWDYKFHVYVFDQYGKDLHTLTVSPIPVYELIDKIVDEYALRRRVHVLSVEQLDQNGETVSVTGDVEVNPTKPFFVQVYQGKIDLVDQVEFEAVPAVLAEFSIDDFIQDATLLHSVQDKFSNGLELEPMELSKVCKQLGIVLNELLYRRPSTFRERSLLLSHSLRHYKHAVLDQFTRVDRHDRSSRYHQKSPLAQITEEYYRSVNKRVEKIRALYTQLRQQTGPDMIKPATSQSHTLTPSTPLPSAPRALPQIMNQVNTTRKRPAIMRKGPFRVPAWSPEDDGASVQKSARLDLNNEAIRQVANASAYIYLFDHNNTFMAKQQRDGRRCQVDQMLKENGLSIANVISMEGVDGFCNLHALKTGEQVPLHEHVVVSVCTDPSMINCRGERIVDFFPNVDITDLIHSSPQRTRWMHKLKRGTPFVGPDIRDLCRVMALAVQKVCMSRRATIQERTVFVRHMFRNFPEVNVDDFLCERNVYMMQQCKVHTNVFRKRRRRQIIKFLGLNNANAELTDTSNLNEVEEDSPDWTLDDHVVHATSGQATRNSLGPAADRLERTQPSSGARLPHVWPTAQFTHFSGPLLIRDEEEAALEPIQSSTPNKPTSNPANPEWPSSSRLNFDVDPVGCSTGGAIVQHDAADELRVKVEDAVADEHGNPLSDLTTKVDPRCALVEPANPSQVVIFDQRLKLVKVVPYTDHTNRERVVSLVSTSLSIPEDLVMFVEVLDQEKTREMDQGFKFYDGMVFVQVYLGRKTLCLREGLTELPPEMKRLTLRKVFNKSPYLEPVLSGRILTETEMRGVACRVARKILEYSPITRPTKAQCLLLFDHLFAGIPGGLKQEIFRIRTEYQRKAERRAIITAQMDYLIAVRNQQRRTFIRAYMRDPQHVARLSVACQPKLSSSNQYSPLKRKSLIISEVPNKKRNDTNGSANDNHSSELSTEAQLPRDSSPSTNDTVLDDTERIPEAVDGEQSHQADQISENSLMRKEPEENGEHLEQDQVQDMPQSSGSSPTENVHEQQLKQEDTTEHHIDQEHQNNIHNQPENIDNTMTTEGSLGDLEISEQHSELHIAPSEGVDDDNDDIELRILLLDGRLRCLSLLKVRLEPNTPMIVHHLFCRFHYKGDQIFIIEKFRRDPQGEPQLVPAINTQVQSHDYVVVIRIFSADNPELISQPFTQLPNFLTRISFRQKLNSMGEEYRKILHKLSKNTMLTPCETSLAARVIGDLLHRHIIHRQSTIRERNLFFTHCMNEFPAYKFKTLFTQKESVNKMSQLERGFNNAYIYATQQRIQASVKHLGAPRPVNVRLVVKQSGSNTKEPQGHPATGVQPNDATPEGNEPAVIAAGPGSTQSNLRTQHLGIQEKDDENEGPNNETQIDQSASNRDEASPSAMAAKKQRTSRNATSTVSEAYRKPDGGALHRPNRSQWQERGWNPWMSNQMSISQHRPVGSYPSPSRPPTSHNAHWPEPRQKFTWTPGPNNQWPPRPQVQFGPMNPPRPFQPPRPTSTRFNANLSYQPQTNQRHTNRF